ncbi:MAG: hypothetical protein WCK34_14515 [Bacteroidota bacterium]
METNDKFSEHDSFRIINEMINTAKHGIADNSFPYLLWGWLVFLASISNYILLVVVKTDYNWLPWPIFMGLGGVIGIIYSIRENREQTVKTYVDRFLGYTWTSLLTGLFLTMFIGAKAGPEVVYPVIMILYGIGLFISGRAFGFLPLVMGGIGCWGCAVLACFVHFEIQLILLGLSVMVGYIIPGYILKLKFRHESTL